MWRLALVCVATGCNGLLGIHAFAADAEAGELDSDSDGIVDALDNCPMIANADQRDFDGDHHGDVCDRCPHIASIDDPDGDDDGVGDACDPRPGLADRRVEWVAFYDADEVAAWRRSGGTWTVANDQLEQSDPTAPLAVFGSPTDHGAVSFATRIEITKIPDSDGYFGACGANKPNMGFFCCAVLQGSTTGVRAESGTASASTETMDAAFAGTTTVGSKIAIVGDMGMSTSSCTFTQGAARTTTTIAALSLPPASASMFTSHAQGKFDYLFVVEEP